MSKKIYGHQGDVEFRQISTLPSDAVLKSTNTVAYGEMTGHHHTFDPNAKVYQTQTSQYVVLETPQYLRHQEHEDKLLPTGVYEINIQREVDLLGQVRPVLD